MGNDFRMASVEESEHGVVSLPEWMKDFEINDYDRRLLRRVKSVYFSKIAEKTTVCVLKLTIGFEVPGFSACVNPNDFDFDIGCKYAMKDALRKLDEFIGYSLQESRYLELQGIC